MNELLKLIKDNPETYKEILKNSPYNLLINEDGKYLLLKYNQILSDYNLPEVRQSRGCIINTETLEYVCVPFYKFFNSYEKYADKIDWNTAKVQEKLDGSIMKLWFDDGIWHISTNGIIDAKKAETKDILYSNFIDIFNKATEKFNSNWKDSLNKECTYIFELCSPINKVVVSHNDFKIHHIGTRNNKTLQENNEYVGVEQPKVFNLKNQLEVEQFAETLDSTMEGFVVVDSNWNRVKIKSPLYIMLHNKISNHQINNEDILNMILSNEQSEFLSYFPEYKKVFSRVRGLILNTMKDLDDCSKKFDIDKKLSKKEFALKYKDSYYSRYFFTLYNKYLDNSIYYSFIDFVRYYTLK